MRYALIYSSLCTMGLSAGTAQADVITFIGDTRNFNQGQSEQEGSFTYGTQPSILSGRLVRLAGIGNPGGSIAGDSDFGLGGAVLEVHRTGPAGLPFRFESIDLAQEKYSGSVPIEVRGFLNDVQVGSETYNTVGGNRNFTTFTASNLSGVTIDRLEVSLDAYLDFDIINGIELRREFADNLVLTVVPEPTSLALLGLGGLISMRRPRRSI